MVFDMDGFILFNTTTGLQQIINQLRSEEDQARTYNRMLPAAICNFCTALKFTDQFTYKRLVAEFIGVRGELKCGVCMK